MIAVAQEPRAGHEHDREALEAFRKRVAALDRVLTRRHFGSYGVPTLLEDDWTFHEMVNAERSGR